MTYRAVDLARLLILLLAAVSLSFLYTTQFSGVERISISAEVGAANPFFIKGDVVEFSLEVEGFFTVGVEPYASLTIYVYSLEADLIDVISIDVSRRGSTELPEGVAYIVPVVEYIEGVERIWLIVRS